MLQELLLGTLDQTFELLAPGSALVSKEAHRIVVVCCCITMYHVVVLRI